MNQKMIYDTHRTQCIARQVPELEGMVDEGIAFKASNGKAYWAKASDFKWYVEQLDEPSFQERAYLTVAEDNDDMWLAWYSQRSRKGVRYTPRVGERVSIISRAKPKYIGTIEESRYQDDKRRYGAFELVISHI